MSYASVNRYASYVAETNVKTGDYTNAKTACNEKTNNEKTF